MRAIIKKIEIRELPSPGKLLADSSGIALITALMFTMISLTIVMSLMYMMTQSTKVSGANKRYKTAIDASYGGVELFAKDMLPFLMLNATSTTLASQITSAYGSNTVIGQSSSATDVACLQAKLRNPSSKWVAAGCSSTSSSSTPTDHPDMTFQVSSASGSPYTIYSKIVETKTGNSDISGLQLDGSGVAEAGTAISPMHYPYVYRLEIQGQQSATSERANIEVLYAY